MSLGSFGTLKVAGLADSYVGRVLSFIFFYFYIGMQ